MKQVVINVTQDDINEGIRLESNKCPLALAMIRAGLKSPSVGPRTLTWVAGRWIFQHLKAVDTPLYVTTFISKFDAFGQRDVLPFSFVLEY